MAEAPVLDVDVRHCLGDFELEARFAASSGLTALFGRSGSGKTTLINVLAGLERPASGRIVVGDKVLFDSAAGIDLPPEHRRLGYVFQEGRLFPHLSVRANLRYGTRFAPAGDRHQSLDAVVWLLDLGPLLDRRPGTLSGGEKQRVAIGRALLASPRLLLMDEPLASLDAQRRGEILPYIESLRDDLGIPVVYVSHSVEEVVRLADTLVLLSEGRTVAAGSVEEIMSRLDLRPLTGRHEAGAVLAVRVAGHDDGFKLTRLAPDRTELVVPRLPMAEGTPLRVRVRARDVALSLSRPSDVSFLNVIEGRVAEIEAGDGPQVDVLLDVGQPLVARITRKSVHDLGIAPGAPVFALIKAVAIDRHSLGLADERRSPTP